MNTRIPADVFHPIRALIHTLVLASAMVGAVNAAGSADEATVTGPVLEFNAAITARDPERALATLWDGGVQFQLRAAHAGIDTGSALTTELASSWRSVLSILLPATDSYERVAEVTAVLVDGDMATVWTRTRTVSMRKQATEPSIQEFSELYLLVQRDGKWKIAAQGANRAQDNLLLR